MRGQVIHNVSTVIYISIHGTKFVHYMNITNYNVYNILQLGIYKQ